MPLDLGLPTHSLTAAAIAYERLLLDLIEGDPTLFVRRDEVEAQWAWIEDSAAGKHRTDPECIQLDRGGRRRRRG